MRQQRMKYKKKTLQAIPFLSKRELTLLWRNIRWSAELCSIMRYHSTVNDLVEVLTEIEWACIARFGEAPSDYRNQEGREELDGIFDKIINTKWPK